LTVARARERIAMYINGYSNITHRAQKERQGRPEQTPRVNIQMDIGPVVVNRAYPILEKCIECMTITYM